MLFGVLQLIHHISPVYAVCILFIIDLVGIYSLGVLIHHRSLERFVGTSVCAQVCVCVSIMSYQKMTLI